LDAIKLLDIIIKNGKIVDGSGNPWFKADVGIKDGKIKSVNDLTGIQSERIIDAKGLVVAPGFVEVHSHSDLKYMVDPSAQSFLRQGVTTEVVGNCGGSAAPLSDVNRNLIKERYQEYLPYVDFDWTSYHEYLDRAEKKGSNVNLAFLVGHGTMRSAVMGYETREATREEIEKMKDLTAEAMEAGAFGMSTGLVYHPGVYANTDEIVDLCEVVAKYGGVYSTHKRGQGDEFIEATREAIEIGERAGIRVQVSHHAPNLTCWGRNQESIEMMEHAREKGVEVLADKHGYIYGSGSLTTIFPPWFRMQTIEKQIEQLKDPQIREQIKQEAGGTLTWPRVTPALLARAGKWDGLVIMGGVRKEFIGKNLDEIAKSTGKNPFDIIFDLMIESNMSVRTINTNYNEKDLQDGYRSNIMMVSADASAFSPEGPLMEMLMEGRLEHAKVYGTFPQIFRKYVRGENREDMPLEQGSAKILTLENAVKKMTSLPTQMFHMWDRGLIRIEMCADIVVFNPDIISDSSTYFKPYEYPSGIEYVLVNGEIAIKNGDYTGAIAGKILRFKPDVLARLD
jgi:N-acyl-D-amino-acid deacylase